MNPVVEILYLAEVKLINHTSVVERVDAKSQYTGFKIKMATEVEVIKFVHLLEHDIDGRGEVSFLLR
jgi:hypothetical protein